MGTEILKSFGNLQHELDEAKSSLKGVDESIKRLIGRDPSELPPRNVQKRPLDDKGRPVKAPPRIRNFAHENEEPPLKRRSNISVFKRLSDKVPDDEHHLPHKGLISKVIVTPKEVPSRQQALEAQNKDEKFKARNKRMFGALLGTLQKFQQEETKLKQREQKRAELEKKIEDHEIKEKEEVRKERQELFFNRKKKQAEIKVIELKMLRMKEYAQWEQSQKPRMNYILTNSKPQIHYLPRKMTDQSKKLLEESNTNLKDILEAKKKQIADELQHIEDKMKKNFDYKFGHKEEKEENTEGDSRRRHHDDDQDQDEQDDDIHTEAMDVANVEVDEKEKIKSEDSETKELEQDQENSVTERIVEVPTDNGLNTTVTELSEPVTDSNDDASGVNNPVTNLNDVSVKNAEDASISETNIAFQSTEFQSDYNLQELQSMYDPQVLPPGYNEGLQPDLNSKESQVQSDYNSQDTQHNYISVQMGNFGPQTSD